MNSLVTQMDRTDYRPYVTTYSGKKIFIDNPDEDQILLKDIYHQTAMKCRFGGAVKDFYSVAQHSVYCFWAAQKMEVNLPTQAAILLHDANEAAYPDVQRPIKMFLPEWKNVEDPLENAIYEKYIGPYQEFVDWDALKKIDNILLVLEGRELLNDAVWSWEDHWKSAFKDTPFDWNDDIDQIAKPFFLPWDWRLAKVRFKRELDNLAQLMVASDPEWNAMYKELRQDDNG